MYSNKKICVIAANNSLTEDNQLIDYIKLASIAAERVKYYLGLDTCLITNDETTASQYYNFCKIIEYNPHKITKRALAVSDKLIKYNWYNDCRIAAFDLTKDIADRVLMIDADYIVASDQLLSWTTADYPFLIFDNAVDVAGKGTYDAFKTCPSKDIIQRWATAICFDHSEESKIIFETAKMVRDNYEFYSLMFGFPTSPFRNDLAFSVACHLHNVPKNPTVKLFNVPPSSHIRYLSKPNTWLIISGIRASFCSHDIHVLNKNYAIDNFLMNQLRLSNVQA